MLNFDWINVLGIAALGQAALLSAYMMVIAGRQLAQWLLTLSLITLAIALAHDVFLQSKLALHFPYLLGTGPFATYLIGPLILLVSYKIIWPEKPYSKWHLLHFVPFVVQQWNATATYLMSSGQKTAFLEQYYQAATDSVLVPNFSITTVVSLLTFYAPRFVYFLYVLWLLQNNRQDIQHAQPVRRLGYRALQYGLLGYCLLWALHRALTYWEFSSVWALEYQPALNAAMLSSTIILFAVMALRFPLDDLFSPKTSKKYKNSELDEGTANSLIKKIEAYLTVEGNFSNPDIRQSDVANALQLSPQLISQIINSQTGMSFNQYINRQRVDALKLLLQCSENQHKDILTLAFEAGFNSKPTLNRVFKQQVGTTPTAYRSHYFCAVRN